MAGRGLPCDPLGRPQQQGMGTRLASSHEHEAAASSTPGCGAGAYAGYQPHMRERRALTREPRPRRDRVAGNRARSGDVFAVCGEGHMCVVLIEGDV